MLLEHLTNKWRQVNLPPSPCRLRFKLNISPACNEAHTTLNMHTSVIKADISPAKSEQFPGSHPRCHCQCKQPLQTVSTHRLYPLLCLIFRQRLDLMSCSPRQRNRI